MSSNDMVVNGEEGKFISKFWLDQATSSFNLVKTMLEERILTVKSLKNKLEDRDTRVLELLTTVVELRKTLEERDTIYETNLKTALAVKDTINADLCKAIEEQRDALNHLRGVAIDN